MIYRAPGYCRDFRCKAGDCRDSCCKGWEIDIDSETAALYGSIVGDFGERLRRSIHNGSFVLSEDERCPFLNGRGLCDIYTELGEESLCDICRCHPRYFEWFGSFKEGGIGLCCEAAAELILSRPFSLCEEEVPDEEASGEYDGELMELLLAARGEMLELLNDEKTPLGEALIAVMDKAAEVQSCIDIPGPEESKGNGDGDAAAQILACLGELEPIDGKWKPFIRHCAELLPKIGSCGGRHTYLRRIALYFIYRYFLKSVYDGEVLGRTKLAAFSVLGVDVMFRCREAETGSCGFEECAELAKDYSKEVEYCEENTERLLELFRSEACFSAENLGKTLEKAFGGNVGNS